MPSLDLNIERLERLVGKKLNIKELEYDLQWISLDLEDINEEEQKIKVEYNPNRPDFSSPEGIARAPSRRSPRRAQPLAVLGRDPAVLDLDARS